MLRTEGGSWEEVNMENAEVKVLFVGGLVKKANLSIN